ncbi:metal ABC transporter substrate-binding protein [Brevibacillus dissolubilis]|uniref:metal ABC transporter substrate-binding protein n=1 Tax=Brevibacillus dissolubilis TaxID=1844116 RepID=UPI0021002F24|nr:metal ABC transporter substrate-binding protein [Brevibacillus dissolubilis]
MSALLTTGCGAPATQAGNGVVAETSAEQTGQLTVYTSFYPLYYVTSRIAGEHAEVTNIVPAGVEPHDFEPTAKDVIDMSKAKLFIYNGSGLEGWIDKALEGMDQSNMTVVKATDGLTLLSAEAGHEHEEHAGEAATETSADAHGHEAHAGEAATTEGTEQGHDEHGHAEHGEFDPHTWLDPSLLKQQAEKVRDTLIKLDAAHKADYEQNYTKLAADLDALDQEFKDMAAKAPKKEFMVAHSAFTYLAHRYGLEQVSISGISPADEPSPAEMKELVEHVKEHKISYVMFETLVSPKVAEVIAREANVKTATLNPLEGLTVEEEKAGKDYLSIMRENMETLRTALQ